MADFGEADLVTIGNQFGMRPEQVAAQLQAEGHNVLPSAGSMAGYMGGTAQDLPVDQQVPIPADNAPIGQQIGAMNLQPRQLSPLQQQVQLEMARQDAGSRAAPSLAPPGANTGGQRIRATGAGLPQQQPQPQGTGSLSRVRKLFDARQRGLEAEYAQAAEAYGQSRDKLGQLQQDAFGFQQQDLDAQARAAQTAAGMYDQLGQDQARAVQAEQEAKVREDGVLQAKQQQIDTMRQDWAKQRVQAPSMGARTSAAIAVALSSIGDAMSAGAGRQTQYAAQTQQLIDNAINRDVEDQLRNIQTRREALTDEERTLSNMRGQFANDAAFRTYLRGAQKEAIATRLEALAAKSNSETAQVTAKAAATNFRMQSEAEMAEGLGANMEETRKRLREQADARFGLEVGLAMPKAGPAGEKQTPGVVGLVQVAPEATGEDRKKAQEIVSKNNSLLTTIRELKTMSQGGGTLDQTKRAHVTQLLNRFIGQNSQAFGSGTPQEAEAKRAMDAMADPTAIITTKDAIRAYDMLERSTIDSANAQIQPYGYAIGGGTTGMARDE